MPPVDPVSAQVARVADGLRDARALVDEQARRRPRPVPVVPDRVYLFYRLAPDIDRDESIGVLRELLRRAGFTMVTSARMHGFASAPVLERIQESEFVVALFTHFYRLIGDGPQYLPSPWVNQEARAAVAAGKPIVLMVENGEVDIGGLHGDRRPQHFDRNSFADCAIAAVDDLKALRQLCRDGAR